MELSFELDTLPKDFQYIVYEYEYDGNNTSGALILKTKDGLFFEYTLEHCSCYGPFKDAKDCRELSKESIMNNNINIHDNPYWVKDSVKEKVVELEKWA